VETKSLSQVMMAYQFFFDLEKIFQAMEITLKNSLRQDKVQVYTTFGSWA